jgi:hypothetical protein
MSSRTSRPSPWLTAEEAAPQLATTAHNLRRLARLARSPILTRRVGSRWLFSRADPRRLHLPGRLVADPPPAAILSGDPESDAANGPSTSPPPQTPASATPILPGFEAVALQPTIKGRTCIADAPARSRSTEA